MDSSMKIFTISIKESLRFYNAPQNIAYPRTLSEFFKINSMSIHSPDNFEEQSTELDAGKSQINKSAPLDNKQEGLRLLAKKRENGEINQELFDLINWLNYSDGRALTKIDLGNQAIVLLPEEFQDIGILTIRLPSGKELDLDADDFPSGDVLIIYPNDLG